MYIQQDSRGKVLFEKSTLPRTPTLKNFYKKGCTENFLFSKSN